MQIMDINNFPLTLGGILLCGTDLMNCTRLGSADKINTTLISCCLLTPVLLRLVLLLPFRDFCLFQAQG